jgi:hypothetical protein
MSSIRAREVSRQRSRERYAAQAEAAREAEEIRRSMLPRKAAARYLGLSEVYLRDAWAAGVGPRAVKLGTCRQSRVLYPLEELDRWRSDPLGYSTPARDCGPFEPPRRGDRNRDQQEPAR